MKPIETDYEKVFKLVIVGVGSIEKTAFIQKFITSIYKIDSRNSTRVKYFIKDLTPDGLGTVRLQIWDFGTEEWFRFPVPTYVKEQME